MTHPPRAGRDWRRQSIIPFIRSILFLMLKLIKFVSMRTLYGGLSVALYLPKSAADWVSTRLSLGSSRNCLFDLPSYRRRAWGYP